MKDLFELAYHNKEAEAHSLTRPLADVSNFVVDTLPSVLEEVRGGRVGVDALAGYVDRLLVQLPMSVVHNVLVDQRSRDLAGLDLKILDTAIAHSGGNPPERLTSLVNEFSEVTDQPAGITYEEIILVNPVQDRRTFTRGEVMVTEAAFYEGHRIIEEHLDRAIDIVKGGIQKLTEGVGGIDEVAGNIRQTQEDLKAVILKTHALGAQSREHFSEFRKYLSTHPIRGTKGPSGAFTAGIPTLELLLAGESLPEEYIQYLEENKIYFPRQGRKNIQNARESMSNGLTLTSLAIHLGDPYVLGQNINGFSQLVRRFRGEHYKAVRNQIPEAISGKMAGTAGEQDPGTFLRNRMRIRHLKENKYDKT